MKKILILIFILSAYVGFSQVERPAIIADSLRGILVQADSSYQHTTGTENIFGIQNYYNDQYITTGKKLYFDSIGGTDNIYSNGSDIIINVNNTRNVRFRPNQTGFDKGVLMYEPLSLGQSGGTSGQINWVASDGDAGSIAIDTSDILTINNFTGVQLTIGTNFIIPSTNVVFLDGGFDTYLTESTADIMDFYVGGTNLIKLTEAETDQIDLNALVTKLTVAGITAGTTQTQGQVPLTANINEVATCGNTNDVVTLMTAVAGYEIFIINNGAETLQIFPASGDDLGAGVNTSTTLAAGSNLTLVSYDATNWETK